MLVVIVTAPSLRLQKITLRLFVNLLCLPVLLKFVGRSTSVVDVANEAVCNVVYFGMDTILMEYGILSASRAV